MDRKRMEVKSVNYATSKEHKFANRTVELAFAYQDGYTEGYADAEQRVKVLREALVVAQKLVTPYASCEDEWHRSDDLLDKLAALFKESLRLVNEVQK